MDWNRRSSSSLIIYNDIFILIVSTQHHFKLTLLASFDSYVREVGSCVRAALPLGSYVRAALPPAGSYVRAALSPGSYVRVALPPG